MIGNIPRSLAEKSPLPPPPPTLQTRGLSPWSLRHHGVGGAQESRALARLSEDAGKVTTSGGTPAVADGRLRTPREGKGQGLLGPAWLLTLTLQHFYLL